MPSFRTGFVAPDGTPLAGFVGAGGVTFAPAGYSGGLGILANRVTHVAPNSPALYAASIKPNTADCYTEALLYVVTAASNARGGAALRIALESGNKAAFYALRYHGGTRAWQIVRVTGSGTPVVIGSAAVNPAAGSRWLLRLEAAGSQLTAYVDGVEVLAVTDDTVTASGAVGITWDSGSVGGADGQHFEELAGGDLGAPPPAGVTVGVGSIASTARTFALTVARTAASVRLGAIGSSASVFAPAIAEGIPATVVQLGRITSSAELHAPTVAPTAASVQLPQIGAASRIYSASITTGRPGASTVRLGAIGTQATTFAPAVLRARSTVALDLLESGASLFTPALTKGTPAARVQLGRIASSAKLHSPALRPGGVVVELTVIVSRGLVLPPTFGARMVGYLTVGRVTLAPALTASARLEPALSGRVSLLPLQR